MDFESGRAMDYQPLVDQPLVEQQLDRRRYEISMNSLKADLYMYSFPEHVMFFVAIPLAWTGHNDLVMILALLVTSAISWWKSRKASNNFAKTANVRWPAAHFSFDKWRTRRNCVGRSSKLQWLILMSAFLYYEGISSVNAIAEIDHTWGEASQRRWTQLMDTQGMGVFSGVPASTLMLRLVIFVHLLQIGGTIWALEKMDSARGSMLGEARNPDASCPQYYRFPENTMWHLYALGCDIQNMPDLKYMASYFIRMSRPTPAELTHGVFTEETAHGFYHEGFTDPVKLVFRDLVKRTAVGLPKIMVIGVSWPEVKGSKLALYVAVAVVIINSWVVSATTVCRSMMRMKEADQRVEVTFIVCVLSSFEAIALTFYAYMTLFGCPSHMMSVMYHVGCLDDPMEM